MLNRVTFLKFIDALSSIVSKQQRLIYEDIFNMRWIIHCVILDYIHIKKWGDNMKDFLIGLLAFLAICSSALNVYMFIQLESSQGSNNAAQISSDNSVPIQDNNSINDYFNNNLIGDWTNGNNDRFRVMADGTAYLVSYFSHFSGSGQNDEKPIFSLAYGYMDANNFVVTQRYEYRDTMNGGDGIYRYSDEEVISNCMTDASVYTYRIVLEGNTITGFGDTRRQFVRE